MKIQIDGNMYLTSDPLNYIVSEFGTNAKGEETKVDLSFHRTAEDAINSILEKKVRKSKCTTFEGLQKEFQKTNKLREEIISKLSVKPIDKPVKK